MKPSFKRVAVFVNNQIWVLRGAYGLEISDVVDFFSRLDKGKAKVGLVAYPELTHILLPKQLIDAQRTAPQKLQRSLVDIGIAEEELSDWGLWISDADSRHDYGRAALRLVEVRTGFVISFPEGRFWMFKNEIFMLEFPVSAKDLREFFLANPSGIAPAGDDAKESI